MCILLRNEDMLYSKNSKPLEGVNHKIFYLLEEAYKNVCENKKFGIGWLTDADKVIDELNELANPTKYFKLIEHNGVLGLLRGYTRPFYPHEDYKKDIHRRFIPLHSKQQSKTSRKFLNNKAGKIFTKEQFYYCQDKSRNNSMRILLRIKSYSPFIVSSDSSFVIGE